MAQNKNSNNEEVADYSSYFKKQGAVAKNAMAPQSPIQEMAAARKFNKRAFTLFIVLLALAIAQGILLFAWNKSSAPSVPEGYELVSPKNQPAFIQPIK